VILVLSVVSVHALQVGGNDSAEKDLSRWITNAVQWDSVWRDDEFTCPSGKSRLSSQLASAKDHTFRMETARYTDGVVALLPELHRLISIRLTPDGQLASVSIELTCEPDLASHYAKLKSLRRPEVPQDPRLQRHLEELQKLATPPSIQESPATIGVLEIGAPVLKPPSRKTNWPRTKVDALKSVEAAAQKAFDEVCTRGSSAVVAIPDFELYDPAVVTVIRAKDLSCVLPIGFEHRRSPADPYVAYATYNCIEDQGSVKKAQRLIALRRVETKNLTCKSSPN